MNHPFEPQLVEDARRAIRDNPGYVPHGPMVCPRDIIEAFELGVSWGRADAASSDGGATDDDDQILAIRNPLRTLKRETAHRLAELAADLECGLSAQASILTDWTTPAERESLDGAAASKLAYQRLANALREVLAAAEPRDGAAASEIAEQMSAAAARLSHLDDLAAA
jgi:hypothetical protein